MCVKAIDTFTFVCNSVPDRQKTQEICDKVVSKDLFMLKYCLDRYKTQETLKFVPVWFVVKK